MSEPFIATPPFPQDTLGDRLLEDWDQIQRALLEYRAIHAAALIGLDELEEQAAEIEKKIKQLAHARRQSWQSSGWSVRVTPAARRTYSHAILDELAWLREEPGIVTETIDYQAVRRLVDSGQLPPDVAGQYEIVTPLTPRVSIEMKTP